MLLIFGDGSTMASCALTYLRWQMADGTMQCRLLAGKMRVAPKCKISIPRMELMGALLVVRLAVQETGQEIGGAEDGASPGAPDGTAAAFLVNGGESVRASPHQRVGAQAFHPEGLGVIFVCTLTSLANVEIGETYSTESFLMAMRRFMALHGAPRRFQSDQGTQLVAASKQMATWDSSGTREKSAVGDSAEPKQ
jgi:hypothetical protein